VITQLQLINIIIIIVVFANRHRSTADYTVPEEQNVVFIFKADNRK